MAVTNLWEVLKGEAALEIPFKALGALSLYNDPQSNKILLKRQIRNAYAPFEELFAWILVLLYKNIIVQNRNNNLNFPKIPFDFIPNIFDHIFPTKKKRLGNKRINIDQQNNYQNLFPKSTKFHPKNLIFSAFFSFWLLYYLTQYRRWNHLKLLYYFQDFLLSFRSFRQQLPIQQRQLHESSTSNVISLVFGYIKRFFVIILNLYLSVYKGWPQKGF